MGLEVVEVNRFATKKRRSAKEIEAEIAYWLAESDACSYCSDECWCDGDWSPAARLSDLRRELAEARRRR